ncbi:MAG: hypothetical protein L5655_09215 [Thermosediminibacteraceae bacterium]|nr:hypothetical protein [Thermosediminibacteraceae bacterium]
MLFHKSGELLRVSFNAPRSHSGVGFRADMPSYTILVPEDIDVEIKNRRSLSIHLENIKSNWVMENTGHVGIIVQNSADAKIKAVVDGKELLGGNVAWKVIGDNEENTHARQNTN